MGASVPNAGALFFLRPAFGIIVAMNDSLKEWFVRTEEGKVYGPATLESLVSWAREGRVEPTGFASKDRINWTPLHLKLWNKLKRSPVYAVLGCESRGLHAALARPRYKRL